MSSEQSTESGARASESDAERQKAFLMGTYDALGWVLTSPRINGELRRRIHARAMEVHGELRGLGVHFTEVADA